MVKTKTSRKGKVTVKKKTPAKKIVKIQAEIPEDLNWDCCSGGPRSSKCWGVYGVGMIGALVYFISNATSFLGGVVGILKAIVWPAFLVHALLGFLGL